MARKWVIFLMVIIFAGCAGIDTKPVSSEVPRMTKEELKAALGSRDLIVIDARAAGHWSASNMKIAGAIREAPAEFSKWYDKYSKDKTLVLYCQ